MIKFIFDFASLLSENARSNMPYIPNLFRISLRGEATNYRPYATPSFEGASHIKNCHFSRI